MYIINKQSHDFCRAIWNKEENFSKAPNFVSLKDLLVLIYSKLHSKSCAYLYYLGTLAKSSNTSFFNPLSVHCKRNLKFYGTLRQNLSKRPRFCASIEFSKKI